MHWHQAGQHPDTALGVDDDQSWGERDGVTLWNGFCGHPYERLAWAV